MQKNGEPEKVSAEVKVAVASNQSNYLNTENESNCYSVNNQL